MLLNHAQTVGVDAGGAPFWSRIYREFGERYFLFSPRLP